MRRSAKTLLTTHRFDEAAELAEEIAKREERETNDAAVRMRHAYHQALERLKQQFHTDRSTMIESYETKKNGLIRAEENNLRPFSQRVEKYQKMKTVADQAAKRTQSSLARPTSTRKPIAPANYTTVALEGKLKLPPLARLQTNM